MSPLHHGLDRCTDTNVQEILGLVSCAQRGDSEAFCLLCGCFEARLLGQATALCGDEVLAMDLVQETLFQAWKSIRRYNGRCQFFTWLCAILLNCSHKERRRKHPQPLSSLKGADEGDAGKLLDTLTDPGELPDLAAQSSEMAALLRSCLKRLPRRHREVVYLRFYIDDSLEGIAAALRCSVGTVKSRLFYALEGLRSMKGLNEELRAYKD